MEPSNIYCHGADGKAIHISSMVMYKSTTNSKERLGIVEGIQVTTDGAHVLLVGHKRWLKSTTMHVMHMERLEWHLVNMFSVYGINLMPKDLELLSENLSDVLQPRMLGDAPVDPMPTSVNEEMIG